MRARWGEQGIGVSPGRVNVDKRPDYSCGGFKVKVHFYPMPSMHRDRCAA